MGCSENLDANECGGWGGIYSPQPLPRRWQGLLAMGAPDSSVRHQTATVHSPERATSARRWGLERLTIEVLCPVAAPDSPVAHQTCLLCSDFLL